MAKMAISELARAIAVRHGMTQKEAERFVNTFIDVVNDGLRNEKQLKIKGLGTFKVIDTKDRESVNVNTGERILIGGRGKITFTPDTVMRELVNKPFAQFQTVVLNDGVDFSDIDATSEEIQSDAENEEVVVAGTEQPQSFAEEPQSFAEEPQSFAEEPQSFAEQPQSFAEQPQNFAEEPQNFAEQPIRIVEDNSTEQEEPSKPLPDELAPADDHPSPEEASSTPPHMLTPLVDFVENEHSVDNDSLKAEENPAGNELKKTDDTPAAATHHHHHHDDHHHHHHNHHRAAIDELTKMQQEEMDSEDNNKKSFGWLWTLLALLLIAGGTYLGYRYGKSSVTEYVEALENEQVALLDSIARMRAHLQTDSITDDRAFLSDSIAKAREDSLAAEEKRKAELEERAKLLPVQQSKEAQRIAAEHAKIAEAKARQSERNRVFAESPAKTTAQPKSQMQTKATAPTQPKAKAEPAQTQANAKALAEAKRYEAANAQVRLGAYSIVGLDKTVTVLKGQTLASISKAYFGPGMECYVQAYNNGITEVKEGMKIKIPKLQLKKKLTKK